MSNSSNDPYELLALDIGDARIGVARAHSVAKIPEPLTILTNNSAASEAIAQLAKQHNSKLLVVGLPVHIHGAHTMQTQKVLDFVDMLKKQVSLQVVLVDESYTSKMADETLHANAMQGHNDAQAACYILERYFQEGALTNV